MSIAIMNKRSARPKKAKTLEFLKEKLKAHSVIGIVRMEPMSETSVHQIRRDLREKGSTLKMAKNTLMKIAIDAVRDEVDNIESLKEYVSGNAAFLFADGSPFEIAQYLANNKVPAAARPGQIAPKDVLVPKMNTGVPPGTFISELNAVGLPTRIERGTIAIPQDTVVVKEGEKVSKGLAIILGRLGITPFEVGLELEVALSDGMLITKEELMKDYPGLLATAHRQALNLAAEIGYVTEETAEAVLATAQAKVLALARALAAIDENALSDELKELASSVPVAAMENTASESSEEQEEEEEEEEEVDEADLGLGSLFG